MTLKFLSYRGDGTDLVRNIAEAQIEGIDLTRPLTDDELVEMIRVTRGDSNFVAMIAEVFETVVAELRRSDPSFDAERHWTRFVPKSQGCAIFDGRNAVLDLRLLFAVILQARWGAPPGTVMAMFESRGES